VIGRQCYSLTNPDFVLTCLTDVRKCGVDVVRDSLIVVCERSLNVAKKHYA